MDISVNIPLITRYFILIEFSLYGAPILRKLKDTLKYSEVDKVLWKELFWIFKVLW